MSDKVSQKRRASIMLESKGIIRGEDILDKFTKDLQGKLVKKIKV